MSEPWYHYVIVREDMPKGAQFAQVLHAAGESAALLGCPLPGDVRAVVLGAKDAAELRATAMKLSDAGIIAQLIMETEGGLAGQPTAIGVVPGSRDRVRPALAHLRILR